MRGRETPTEVGAVWSMAVNKAAPGAFWCSEALVVATKKLVCRLFLLLEALNKPGPLGAMISGATTQPGCSELWI